MRHRVADRPDAAPRRRLMAQAWTLAGLAIVIYVAYLIFMIVKGS